MQISLGKNFSLNRQFWFFGPNLPKKYFWSKTKKCERYHWILHTWIGLSTKFQLKLTILIFVSNLTEKSVSSPKWKKLNTTIENFSVDWQFRIFGPNLPKKGYFRWKTEKVNITIELCIPNFSLNWQFWIFGPNIPKKGISVQKQKRNNTVEFCIFELV